MLPVPAPHVRVCCRLRPLDEDENAKTVCSRIKNSNRILLQDLRHKGVNKVFSFDHVYAEKDSNEEIFQREFVQRDNGSLARLFEGLPVMVLAHGARGTGKSFTMHGVSGPKKKLNGLVPRAVSTVMELRAGYKEDYIVKFSLYDVYSDRVHDLLDGTTTHANQFEAKEEVIKSPEQFSARYRERMRQAARRDADGEAFHTVLHLTVGKLRGPSRDTSMSFRERPSTLQLGSLFLIECGVGVEIRGRSSSAELPHPIVPASSTISWSRPLRKALESSSCTPTLVLLNISPSKSSFVESLMTLSYPEKARSRSHAAPTETPPVEGVRRARRSVSADDACRSVSVDDRKEAPRSVSVDDIRSRQASRFSVDDRKSGRTADGLTLKRSRSVSVEENGSAHKGRDRSFSLPESLPAIKERRSMSVEDKRAARPFSLPEALPAIKEARRSASVDREDNCSAMQDNREGNPIPSVSAVESVVEPLPALTEEVLCAVPDVVSRPATETVRDSASAMEATAEVRNVVVAESTGPGQKGGAASYAKPNSSATRPEAVRSASSKVACPVKRATKGRERSVSAQKTRPIAKIACVELTVPAPLTQAVAKNARLQKTTRSASVECKRPSKFTTVPQPLAAVAASLETKAGCTVASKNAPVVMEERRSVPAKNARPQKKVSRSVSVEGKRTSTTGLEPLAAVVASVETKAGCTVASKNAPVKEECRTVPAKNAFQKKVSRSVSVEGKRTSTTGPEPLAAVLASLETKVDCTVGSKNAPLVMEERRAVPAENSRSKTSPKSVSIEWTRASIAGPEPVAGDESLPSKTQADGPAADAALVKEECHTEAVKKSCPKKTSLSVPVECKRAVTTVIEPVAAGVESLPSKMQSDCAAADAAVVKEECQTESGKNASQKQTAPTLPVECTGLSMTATEPVAAVVAPPETKADCTVSVEKAPVAKDEHATVTAKNAVPNKDAHRPIAVECKRASTTVPDLPAVLASLETNTDCTVAAPVAKGERRMTPAKNATEKKKARPVSVERKRPSTAGTDSLAAVVKPAECIISTKSVPVAKEEHPPVPAKNAPKKTKSRSVSVECKRASTTETDSLAAVVKPADCVVSTKSAPVVKEELPPVPAKSAPKKTKSRSVSVESKRVSTTESDSLAAVVKPAECILSTKSAPVVKEERREAPAKNAPQKKKSPSVSVEIRTSMENRPESAKKSGQPTKNSHPTTAAPAKVATECTKCSASAAEERDTVAALVASVAEALRIQKANKRAKACIRASRIPRPARKKRSVSVEPVRPPPAIKSGTVSARRTSVSSTASSECTIIDESLQPRAASPIAFNSPHVSFAKTAVRSVTFEDEASSKFKTPPRTPAVKYEETCSAQDLVRQILPFARWPATPQSARSR